ncbi:hypothetical protein GGTG_04810 [Gaeumannomyces tritici R3-111a-1]|uniref:Uncharacterized protein n=1 Tax=Gaeumannomyces tritici (strain R3-111a-1) TaxID=644352 RepID=J3NU55_GAET3|nr:hypothetical protein GGTG_04810 [Gaeumannomyces tritici R3-111a-1]EJT79726.1 hypothetical protein GGTG_04810 [Gaeumannomyces tritici R3-111a-1]
MPLNNGLPVKTFKFTFKSLLTTFIAGLNFFSKTTFTFTACFGASPLLLLRRKRLKRMQIFAFYLKICLIISLNTFLKRKYKRFLLKKL